VPIARAGSLPARIVFFGSGPFAVAVLDAVATLAGCEVVGVVTAPERPAGRGLATAATAVASRAEALGFPVLRPPSLRDTAVAGSIAGLRPDLGVLADYGRIVPRAILEIPPHGILNVHPSILPRHRGATPIAATIAAGDAEAGVAIIAMDEGLDTGPIVALDRWPLRGDEDAPALEDAAAQRASELVRSVIPAWLVGAISPVPQPTDGVTLSRPLRREDGRLDPARPAAELERRVRALRPWPGTFVGTRAGRLAVHEAAVVGSQPDDVAGTLVSAGDGLALATSDGRLCLVRVQPAGGRSMTGAELRRGRGQHLIGTRVDPAPTDIVGESGGARHA
jgi:methionyl-tRNA formyltransferase